MLPLGTRRSSFSVAAMSYDVTPKYLILPAFLSLSRAGIVCLTNWFSE
jgi:hypothetical protein